MARHGAFLVLLASVVYPTVQCADTHATLDPTVAENASGHLNASVEPTSSMWGWWAKQTLTPVVVLVGILGNTLTLVVMSSKNLRRKSYSQFLCCLALFDNLSLIFTEIELIDQLLMYPGGPSMFRGASNVGCKAYTFLTNSFYVMSAWLVIALAVERVVAIYFPFRKATVCRPCAALVMIVFLFLIAMLTQVFRLVMIGHNGRLCIAPDDQMYLFIALHTYFHLGILIGAIPIAAIAICNALVLWKVARVHRDTQDVNSSSNRIYHSHKRQSKTTRMLLTITFAYIILTLPTFVFSIAVIVTMNLKQPQGIITYSRVQPYVHFADLISTINYSINFFIYVATGHKFRSELRYLIRTRLSSSRSKTSHPASRITLLRLGRRTHSGASFPL